MKEKVLITVKTYPTLSKKYAELVCTAGVTEAGQWRRLYPIRFRQLYEDQKYAKYQWLEAELQKSESDNRPESFKIVGPNINVLGKPLSTAKNWEQRRESFIEKVPVHTDLQKLIDLAHANRVSIAAFKPKTIRKFVCEETDREWDPRKLAILAQQQQQLNLFEDEESIKQQFALVKKLPYKFSYQFEDELGKRSKLMIEDWEIGALYWNCLRSSQTEAEALEKVKAKYWTEFVESKNYDLHLVLGTTLEHHQKKAPNPFVIIGLFYPKFERQIKLF